MTIAMRGKGSYAKHNTELKIHMRDRITTNEVFARFNPSLSQDRVKRTSPNAISLPVRPDGRRCHRTRLESTKTTSPNATTLPV